MDRPRLTSKVVSGLQLAFALVAPTSITPGSQLDSAQAWLAGMVQYYQLDPSRRGRPGKGRRARRA